WRKKFAQNWKQRSPDHSSSFIHWGEIILAPTHLYNDVFWIRRDAMDPGVIGSYGPTLVRYGIVAVGLIGVMILIYRVQIAFGVNREAATGRALVSPWVIGFIVFQLFPIGTSLYLSFTKYNLFKAPEWVSTDNFRDLFSLQGITYQSHEELNAAKLQPGYEEV